MFCTKCGKQLNDGAVFCSYCGFQLEGADERHLSSKEIVGSFQKVASKVPLQLMENEFLIEQHSCAFVLSSIAQGTFSLTNKRIVFTKDSAGKAFFKRGGLLGLALHSGAKIPNEIPLNEIKEIVPTSCLQGKAAMLVTINSGFQYKIALQSMSLTKTAELCEARDRIVSLINGAV